MTIFGLAKLTIMPVIQIQKNDNPAEYYTFNHFTSTYDFRLIRWSIKPPIDDVAGRFQIDITNTRANMAALDAMTDNIDFGNEVIIWIGKTDGTKKKVVLGLIEDIEFDESISSEFYTVHLEGPDFGHAICDNRIVQGDHEQKKLANGVDLDDTDVAVTVEQITLDYLTNVLFYAEPDFTVENQGIVVNSTNIIAGGKKLPQFTAKYEPLSAKLNDLAREIGGAWWVDPDKTFHLQKPQSVDSKVILVDRSNDPFIAAWDPTKVGLILRKGLKNKYTAKYRYQRALGLGGDKRDLDVKQEVVTGSDFLDTQYIAQAFKPTFRRLVVIGVYVGRSALVPTNNLILEVHEDTEATNTRPNGTEIRTIEIDRNSIIEAGDWRYVRVEADLNTSKYHWIIIRQQGDATHRYKWFKTTAGSSLLSATSSDGATWTEVTGATGYAFRVYYSNPLLSSFAEPTGVSAATKLFKEKMYRDPTITDEQRLDSLLVEEGFKQLQAKNTIECYIWSPDIILETFQKVRVRKQGTRKKLDAYYYVADIEYLGQASPTTRTGQFYHRASLTEFKGFIN